MKPLFKSYESCQKYQEGAMGFPFCTFVDLLDPKKDLPEQTASIPFSIQALSVPPKSRSLIYTYETKVESVFVIQGSVSVHLGDKKCALNKYDTLVIPSKIKRFFENTSSDFLELLLVCPLVEENDLVVYEEAVMNVL